MSQSKFSCPSCGRGVSKLKSVCLTNFSTIQCEGCDAKIRPDKKSLSRIGVFGGMLGSIAGGGIGFYTLHSKNWLFGGVAFSILVLTTVLAVGFFTVKYTHFSLEDENTL
ncbi:hypothetical protein [Teredinibacter franksiae]|uniref:hypothetical protein n=1 Tax=Teredinibacter franksiae TaxID=2761453 RepID=UPI001627D072|nr:hypothetical protein [Teredinibacter franksiae]